MDALNLHWFSWMAAGYQPQPVLLAWARLWAVYGGWVAVATMAWLGWRHRAARMYWLGCLLMCLLGVLLAHRLALGIGHARPFMLGLSPAYIAHAARGSLPSVHATALFTVGFCLLRSPALRAGGWVVLAVAALVGWGRVYCGIHFPFDILAGAALGLNLAVVYDWLWIHMAARTKAASTHQGGAAVALGAPE